jgi:hypothetical protein
MKKCSESKFVLGLINRKLVLLTFIVLFSGLTCFAQNEEDIDSTKHEKVEQLKIAYLSKELSLTSSEAEKFWPLYNEMSDKLKLNRKDRKRNVQDLKDKSDVLKDDEIKKKVNILFENENAEVSIKKEYFEKIAQVIGYKKSAKLLNLEQEFRRELLKRLKDQKQQGGGHRQGQKPMRK